MVDYIEREKIALTDFEIAMCNGSYKELCQMLLGKIESIPAADVQPVVRGKWTSVFDIGIVCNQCGYDIEEHGYDVRTDGEPNFCPNCGADLRGE